jgi:hypothetical protein
MSNLHFIGGEKGGVGKSLVSRILAQYFIDHKESFTAFDADQSHGALMRFYSDFTTPVAIDQYDSLDRIVEAALADPDSSILVDLAAQTQQSLLRWMEESDLLGVAEEIGINVTYWHVMDSGRDSVDLLRNLLGQFGGRINLILVKNEIRSSQFGILDASGYIQRAKELGARVISIRRLHEASMQKIDACSTSFWAAANQASSVGGSLGLLERQRVKVWLNVAYTELDRLGILKSNRAAPAAKVVADKALAAVEAPVSDSYTQ